MEPIILSLKQLQGIMEWKRFSDSNILWNKKYKPR